MDNLKDVESKFIIPKKILIIGDVMLDIHSQGTIERISPEAPVPVLSVKKRIYKPGGAGNVAVNITNLTPNSEVHLFGFVGNDTEGYRLKDILSQRGIKCYFDKDSKTITKHRFLGKSTGQFQHLLRVDEEETSEKRFTDETKRTLVQLAEEAEGIIISDYAKGAITCELMEWLYPYREKTVVDPKPKNKDFKTSYKGVYLITPNFREAEEITSCPEIEEAGKRLQTMFQSNILITAGDEGAFLFQDSKEPIKVPTTPQEEFDASGAGDTHLAATVLAKLSGYSLEQAVRIGNYAAGITVKHTGVYAPTLDDLINEIPYKNENPNSRTT